MPQIRDAAKALTEKLYTAANSLEVRLSERISTRAFARIRKVLTEVKNSQGDWERFQLATAPDPAVHPGLFHGGRTAQGCGNRDLGIFASRPVLAPFPVHTAPAMRQAAEAMMGGRSHSLAIPSLDGFSGAGWDCLDVCADVWKSAIHDNNLRNISGFRQNVKPTHFNPPGTVRTHYPPPSFSPNLGHAADRRRRRCALATGGRQLLVGGALG